jgi:hypothetical protein
MDRKDRIYKLESEEQKDKIIANMKAKGWIELWPNSRYYGRQFKHFGHIIITFAHVDNEIWMVY